MRALERNIGLVCRSAVVVASGGETAQRDLIGSISERANDQGIRMLLRNLELGRYHPRVDAFERASLLAQSHFSFNRTRVAFATRL